MDILFYLDSLDAFLFSFFNRMLANPVFDSFMPFITETKHWYIFYVLVGLYLLVFGGPRGRVLVICAIILVTCSDQLSGFLKEVFHRVRPCHSIPNVNLLVGCTDAYSFPSNHAVNNFAAAYLFTYFYPKLKWWFYTCAAIVAMSRVFCGVHYLSDILGGALIGILLGMGIVFIWKKVNERFKILKA